MNDYGQQITGLAKMLGELTETLSDDIDSIKEDINPKQAKEIELLNEEVNTLIDKVPDELAKAMSAIQKKR